MPNLEIDLKASNWPSMRYFGPVVPMSARNFHGKCCRLELPACASPGSSCIGRYATDFMQSEAFNFCPSHQTSVTVQIWLIPKMSVWLFLVGVAGAHERLVNGKTPRKFAKSPQWSGDVTGGRVSFLGKQV